MGVTDISHGTGLSTRTAHIGASCGRSDLLEVDADGRVAGDGEAETTAFALHAAIHAARPTANCIVDTHMPYATALALTEDGLDTRLSQNGAKFHGASTCTTRSTGPGS